MGKLKNIAGIFLRVGMSVILLVLLFKLNKIDIRDLAGDIRAANKFFLSVGFIIFFLIYFLGFLRWRMLVIASGIRIPLLKLVSSFSGGVFFSIFLPSTIGGDVVRTADLAQHSQKAKEVIATVFLDRLSGYIGMAIVLIPALFLGKNLIHDKVVFSSVSVIIIILVAILLVLFNNFIYTRMNMFLSAPGAGRIRETIKEMHQEIYLFRDRKKVVLYNLILSVIIQIISPLSVYFIALSLNININPLLFFIFIPVIGAITLIPISIGGLGLREGLFVVYFAKAGVIKQLALAMSLLSFSFILIYGAIGGLIYVFTVHHRRLQHHQPSSV